MSNIYENEVRREQLKLLRFEKYLRAIAPVVLATGLTVSDINQAHANRATLDNATSVFTQLESETGIGDFITIAVREMDELISRLSVTEPLQMRQATMLQLMEVVDHAHQAAQDSAYRNGIRLIGDRRSNEKADGGTPKLSANAEWFARNFVDGGTPKVSNNAGWLKSRFGF